MATTGRLDLSIWRNDDTYEFPLRILGPDLTGVALRAQIRLGRDVPGAALADLALVTNGNAEGVRRAGTTFVDGVYRNDIRIRLNKSTRQALPYMGEIGDPAVLEWVFTIAGRTRLVGSVAVLAHALDSDAAPFNRPAAYGFARVASLPSDGATLTIAADSVAELVIDGADLIAPMTADAAASKTAAADSAAQAGIAAQTAVTSVGGIMFPTAAAGVAAVAANAYFTVAGDGTNTYAILYRKVNGAAVEQSRYVSKAAYEGPGAPALLGYSDGGVGSITRTMRDRFNDDYVFVTDYGAVADTGTDNLSALMKAVDRGVAKNKPIFIPPAMGLYLTAPGLNPVTGIKGGGSRLSKLGALNAAGYAGNQPIVLINTYGVEVSGFAAIGAGGRTAARTANQADMNFGGDGIRFGVGSNYINGYDVRAEFCRKGVDFNNNDGHLGLDTCLLTNNWWNLFISRNTGDFPITNSLLAGAQYATIGLSGDYSDATAPGGGQLTIKQTHGGFAPKAIAQSPTTQGATPASVGLVDSTLDHFRCEEIGNRAIELIGTNTHGVRIISPGHSWAPTTDTRYVLAGVPAHPVQDVAAVYKSISGGSAGSTMRVEGAGWLVGTSGFHTKITGDVLQFMSDTNGTAGYSVAGQGAERIIDGSQPGGYTTKVVVPTTNLATAATTIAVVNRLGRHATASNVTIHMAFEYTAAAPVNAQIKINGALVQIMRLNGNGSAVLSFNGPLPTTATITIEQAAGVTIFASGFSGYLTYRADYGSATV